MPALFLTDLLVKNHPAPTTGRVELLDTKTEGLVLRVTAAGKRTWSVVFRHHGRKGRVTIGPYPTVGLAEARQAAREIRLKAHQGVDPAAERRDLKGGLTVGDLVDEYARIEAPGLVTGGLRLQTMRRELRGWLNRKVTEVTRRDMVLLADRVRRRAPVQANRLVSMTNRLFSFGVERGVLENNVLLGIRQAPETPRARVLSDDEFRSLWRLGGSAGGALRLMACTGCRPGEAVGAHWREFEGDLWTIPPERTKTSITHLLTVSEICRSVLDEASPEGYLFRGGRHQLTDGPIRRDALTHKLKATHTAHDVRRSVRSRLSELGVKRDIAERILGHKQRGVLGVYDRYDYLPEIREALNAWSDNLRQIVDSG